MEQIAWFSLTASVQRVRVSVWVELERFLQLLLFISFLCAAATASMACPCQAPFCLINYYEVGHGFLLPNLFHWGREGTRSHTDTQSSNGHSLTGSLQIWNVLLDKGYKDEQKYIPRVHPGWWEKGPFCRSVGNREARAGIISIRCPGTQSKS